MNIESYTRIDENAKIAGVALIPRISRNQNLYTKEELKRFDNVTVPLNWEHNSEKVIGKATFHYNSETETVFYEGEITDPSAAILAKNRLLYTSIEATPVSVKQVCNGDSDCFHMPFGLKPEGLAITETPGVPETSVSIIENYIRECNDPSKHRTLVKDRETGEFKEVPHEEHENVDNIMKSVVADQVKDIEKQIEHKNEILSIFRKISDDYPEPMIYDQIEMLENDVSFLTNQIIGFKKDSEYISIEKTLESITKDMKERYLCDCCGELKKKL